MNGGHVCRTSEDIMSTSFHADVLGLCAALGAPSEPPPSSGRSSAATLPYTDPFAATLTASPELGTSDHPDWCVDVGPELLTMTTFALWEAIERGQVMAWMRVWREGMECWTPIGEIAEFTWAIAGTPSPPQEPEPLPESEPPAEAKTGPLPASHPAPPSLVAIETPPASAVRPIAPVPSTKHRRGARWIALGSAVALAAVVSAIFLGQSAPPPPVQLAGAALPVAPPVEPTVLAPAPPPDDRPAPEAAAHHDERGQRRLPRGGRRAAYGR